MIHTATQTLRRSDTLLEDFMGCAALAIFLIAGLHLPLL
ncbi:hypothetical protein PAA8504_00070 [Palleronia abyssalis]|mgnify:CR=1 FL=1|uniref:Uncharacterized protein n=1 Tax=Palleronia abyssalis TaxID=1501240 RepID=A0A2R8BQ28_9RHOB|nr:hypothetical protein PAA8504_00070 [Palleronia abyssalis]